MDLTAGLPYLVQSGTILVPGLLLTAAFLPASAISVPGRLALTYAGGFIAVSFSSWVLICFSALAPWTFLTVLLTICVVAGTVAVRRSSPREHLEALRESFRRDGALLTVGIVVLVAVGWAMADSSSLFSLGNTALRFWGDGAEIADVGGIPEKTLQYGQSWAPATSKMLFNSHTAAIATLSSDALPAISASIWLVTVFLCAVLWWVGWELGLRWLSPLLPLLTVLNGVIIGNEISADLRPYRAESYGRVLAFSGLALAIAAARERKPWPAHIYLGLLFGFAAGTHLVPTVLCLSMLGAFYLSLLIRKTVTKDLLVKVAGALLIAIGVIVCAWATPGANLGFEGTVKADAGAPTDIDGTALFATGERLSLSDAKARTWYVDPGQLLSRLVEEGVSVSTDSPILWLALGVAAFLILALVLPAPLRDGAVTGASLIAAIVAGTLLFNYLYSSYALALFGRRRLFDYAAVPTWLLILTLGALGLIAIESRTRRVAAIVGVTVTLVSGALLVPEVRALDPSPEAASEIRVLEWVRNNTECDARILSNRRSGGTYQVLTGRVLINEGMGPFFRPQMLEEVNSLLGEMNEFFAHPSRERGFLAEQGIDYIVVHEGKKDGRESPRSPSGEPEQLARTSFVEPAFEGGGATIFRVTGIESDTDFADPAAHPGYGCERGDIPL